MRVEIENYTKTIKESMTGANALPDFPSVCLAAVRINSNLTGSRFFIAG